jgi:hypothetical protein
LPKGNNLVNQLYRSMSATLTLSNLLGVSAALLDKILNVQHLGDSRWYDIRSIWLSLVVDFFIVVDSPGRRGRGNCFDHLTWMEGSFFDLDFLGSGDLIKASESRSSGECSSIAVEKKTVIPNLKLGTLGIY